MEVETTTEGAFDVIACNEYSYVDMSITVLRKPALAGLSCSLLLNEVKYRVGAAFFWHNTQI